MGGLEVQADMAPVVVSEDHAARLIWPNIEVLPVGSANDTVMDVAARPEGDWMPLRSPHQHFGVGSTGRAQWARFSLQLDGGAPFRRYLIHEQTFVDRVTLYVQDNGHWRQIQNLRDGSQAWFGGARNPGFTLDLMPGEPQVYLLRTEALSLLRFPLKLYDEVAFLRVERRAYLLAGVLITTPLAISVFMLMMWQVQRQRPLLLAVGLILSEVVGAAWVGGIFQVVAPWLSPVALGNLGVSSWGITALFACLHVRHFLALARDAPVFDAFFRYLPWIIGPSIALELLNLPLGRQVLIYTGFVSTVLFVALAVWQSWRRLPFASLYAFAWGSYAISLTLTVINLQGLIPPNLANMTLFAQGSVASVLFALAVIGQMRAHEVRNQSELRTLADERARIQALEAFRLQFENAPIGLYRARSSGELLRANPAMLQLMGCASVDEAKRKLGPSLWHANPDSHAALIKRTRAERKVTDHEYDGLALQDGIVPRLLENTRFAELDGTGFVYEGAVQNITARYQLEQALRDAHAVTEQVTADRARLFAATNHDLRQPLQTLGLLLELLAPRVSDPQSKRWVEQMKAAQHNLGDILEGLLTLSRLEAGALKPQSEPVAVGPLLQRLSDEYQLIADAKGLALSAMPSRRWVSTDARLLDRMLRNLLANALRYTNRGRVMLGVRGAGDRVRIQVIDTGTGIAPSAQQQIFEAFHQIDSSNPSSREGFGLGLSIVRRLATLVGADVALRSQLGRGSVFELVLPACPLSMEAAPEGEASVELPQLRGRRVLVVEDESGVRDVLHALLVRQGGDVRSAPDGAKALACVAADWQPQTLLLDYRLQGESGLDVLARLRTRLQAMTPAVLLTGQPPAEVPPGVIVMQKPVSAEVLLKQISL